MYHFDFNVLQQNISLNAAEFVLKKFKHINYLSATIETRKLYK